MKVFKFGGSSVKDATAMKKVTTIIENDSSCSIVVVSATQNTTNDLEKIAHYSLESVDKALSVWGLTLNRHKDIQAELSLNISFSEFEIEIENIIKNIHSSNKISLERMDDLYSIGERLSSLLLASYLNKSIKRKVLLKDVKEVLKTSNDFSKAAPLLNEIKNRVWSIDSDELVITQGFIGSTLDGVTTTLGREGSDYSATLLGEAIGCNEVVIWTDVCGVATMDPRIIRDAKFINKMSYSQAATLAGLGAKVLFDRTLGPASRAGFEVIVKSTNEPHQIGTRISKNENSCKLLAMAIEADIISIIGKGIIEADITCHLENVNFQLHECTNEYISFKVPKMQFGECLDHLHTLILKCHHSE